MVHSMGDAFSDIYTFTAYENEMGELFLAEWLFDMGLHIMICGNEEFFYFNLKLVQSF